MFKIRLYLIRHGETTWNKNLCFQGNKNIPLNENGIEQTNKLAKKLKNYKIGHIYTSPLERTIKTSEIIQKETKKEMSKEDGLREILLGEWEGHTLNEIKSKYPELYYQWETNAHAKIGLGVENYFDLQQRAYNTVMKICRNETHSSLLVTHGSWIRAFIWGLFSFPIENRLCFNIDNTGLSIVDYDKDSKKFTLVSLNDVSHL